MAGERDRGGCSEEWFGDLLPLPRSIEAGGEWVTVRSLAAEGECQAVAPALEGALGPWLRGGGRTRVTLAIDAQADRGWPERPPEQLRPEAYELEIGGEVSIRGCSPAGLRHGLQTLRQIMEDAGESGAMPRCRIRDWPRLAYRGIQKDLAREVGYRPAYWARLLERLAYLKINRLYLYLEAAFQYPSCPWAATPEPMTPEDARRLVAQAAALGIEVIPIVNTLGHMEKFLTHPRLKGLAEEGTDYAVCPTHPQTRPFILGLLKDLAEVFPAGDLHIGEDESHRVGTCPRCRKLGSEGELLGEHVRWLIEEVKRLGKTPMLYGDRFLHPDEWPLADACFASSPQQGREALARLPREAIIADWHYTAPYADTVRYFREQGFRVQITTANNVYWHNFLPILSGPRWIVDTMERAIEQGAEGSIHCTWENMRGQWGLDNYWPLDALAAERAWRGGEHDYEGYGRRFARRFWGAERDFYSVLAGQAEEPAIGRQRYLCAGLFEPQRTGAGRLGMRAADMVARGQLMKELASRQLTAAQRNRDTLEMLDLPGHVFEYLGLRAWKGDEALRMLAAGHPQEAAAALQHIRPALLTLAERAEEAHRRYGSALADRDTLAGHLRQLDGTIARLEAMSDEQAARADAKALFFGDARA